MSQELLEAREAVKAKIDALHNDLLKLERAFEALGEPAPAPVQDPGAFFEATAEDPSGAEKQSLFSIEVKRGDKAPSNLSRAEKQSLAMKKRWAAKKKTQPKTPAR